MLKFDKTPTNLRALTAALFLSLPNLADANYTMPKLGEFPTAAESQRKQADTYIKNFMAGKSKHQVSASFTATNEKGKKSDPIEITAISEIKEGRLTTSLQFPKESLIGKYLESLNKEARQAEEREIFIKILEETIDDNDISQGSRELSEAILKLTLKQKIEKK